MYKIIGIYIYIKNVTREVFLSLCCIHCEDGISVEGRKAMEVYILDISRYNLL